MEYSTRTPEKIKEMFEHIAPHYDQNNDIISLLTHRLIKYSVIHNLPELPKNPKVLDLCTGTGDIAKLLKKRYPDAQITGIDFSPEMLLVAKNKCKGINNINFVEADCLNLPFEKEEFDLVTISFGLRNLTDYNKALNEIHRVMKFGGKFMHLDFGKTEKWTNKAFTELVKFIAELQGDESYIYLLDSKTQFPTPEQLIELFSCYNLHFEDRKDYLLGVISAQYFMKI